MERANTPAEGQPSEIAPDDRISSPVRTDRTRGTTPAEGADSLLTFFIPTLEYGGAEQVIVNIVNGLSSRGYDVELLLCQFEEEWRSKLASGVRVLKLPAASTHAPGIVAHLPALVTYLRRENPTALFPHLTHTNVVSLAVTRVLGTDTLVVPTHHLMFEAATDDTPRARAVQWASRYLYPSADRIIAVSEGVADSIVDRTAVKREDISVLYNPIDVEAIRDRAREPVDHEWFGNDEMKVVLFVGRVEEQKDLKTWLRAFKRVHDRDPDTRAVIVGKGQQRADIRAYADDLGIGEVVSIPGYVENPYSYMRGADVFLLSSRFEGLPTVLIEALACGCPVVATNCPCGPREILADGKYGRLTSVGDEAELAEAVTETLADSMPADELRERADAFALEPILDDYEQFLEEHVISR